MFFDPLVFLCIVQFLLKIYGHFLSQYCYDISSCFNLSIIHVRIALYNNNKSMLLFADIGVVLWSVYMTLGLTVPGQVCLLLFYHSEAIYSSPGQKAL